MTSNFDMENTEEYFGEIEAGDLTSVDDFIRQLEAKEKDLHISSDLVIEINESEFDDRNIPDFLLAEISAPPNPVSFSAPPSKPERAVEPVKTQTKSNNDEINGLKIRIAKMEAERQEIFENSRRRQKDFEAYKSRMERERGETFSNQVSNLATQILPVLDNLNRAIDFAEAMPNGHRQFFEGIILVNQQLNEILSGMGVLPIESVGAPFDPHFHEAVAVEETTDFAPNFISAELLKGYRIGEKVIRASMVKVAKPSGG